MKSKEFDKTKRLFVHIGEIDDVILEEAEAADIAVDIATARKRYVRYGTLAAASFGVAITTFLVLRSRRAAANAGSL